MAECGAGSCPQVFVVDSQASYVPLSAERRPWWARAGQKCLLLFVGITVFGFVLQGYLIINLYNRLEAFSIHLSHPPCQNLSNPKSSGQLDGIILGQVGHEESNEIPTEQVQQRPFAHLIGSNMSVVDNVLRWVKNGETIMQRMRYDNGRLVFDRDGFYYVYSKVTVTDLDCSFIQHKVFKDTSRYDKPIELLKSQRFHCWTKRHSNDKASGEQNLWNNFLAGIFELHKGDKVHVTVESAQKTHSGPTDLLGAFMIFP